MIRTHIDAANVFLRLVEISKLGKEIENLDYAIRRQEAARLLKALQEWANSTKDNAKKIGWK